jgi:hypothetical protein
MKSKRAQWALWAITMLIFLDLAFTRHFDWLLVAILVSSLVWYMVVPHSTSR